MLSGLDPRHVEGVCGHRAVCLSSYVWDSIEYGNPQAACSREESRAMRMGV